MALLELALSLPLFLVVIMGFTAVAQLAAARFRLAIVTHAVMREVEMGNTDRAVLEALANAYGEQRGATGPQAYAVRLGDDDAGAAARCSGWVMLGTRVTVRRQVRLSAAVRSFLPATVNLEETAIVLADTWKNPWTRLARLFGMS